MSLQELLMAETDKEIDNAVINWGWAYRQVHKRKKDMRSMRRNKAKLYEGERNTKGYRLACSIFARFGKTTDTYAVENYVDSELGEKCVPSLPHNEVKRLIKNGTKFIQDKGHSKTGNDPFDTIKGIQRWVESHKCRLAKNGQIEIFTKGKWVNASCHLQTLYTWIQADRIRKAIKWVAEGMSSKVVSRIQTVAKKVVSHIFGSIQNMALPQNISIINNGMLINEPMLIGQFVNRIELTDRIRPDRPELLPDRTRIYDRNICVIPNIHEMPMALNIIKDRTPI